MRLHEAEQRNLAYRMTIDPPSAERMVDVALRSVGATTSTSPFPARRLPGLTGRRGGFALLFQK